jgi:hypothetical protein
MRQTVGAALILSASYAANAENTAPATAPSPAPAFAAVVPNPAPSESSTPSTPPAAANPGAAANANPAPDTKAASAKLSCRASRGELGIFETMRFMTLTIDLTNKYVKMAHQGDNKIFEYKDGSTSSSGDRGFVTITDENIVYGRGRETWKIDRYTGTLTNPSISIPFECQLRAAERKF